MNNCPDCGVPFALYSHKPGSGCLSAWYRVLLDATNALMNAVDGAGNLNLNEKNWPLYSDLSLRGPSTIGKIKQIQQSNTMLQDIVNKMNSEKAELPTSQVLRIQTPSNTPNAAKISPQEEADAS